MVGFFLLFAGFVIVGCLWKGHLEERKFYLAAIGIFYWVVVGAIYLLTLEKYSVVYSEALITPPRFFLLNLIAIAFALIPAEIILAFFLGLKNPDSNCLKEKDKKPESEDSI